MGDTQTVLEVRNGGGPVVGIGAREALPPVLVVDGVVDEDAAFADRGPGLARGDPAGLVEIDAVEAGIGRHLQSLDKRERLSARLAGDHSELAGEEDFLAYRRLDERVDRRRVGGVGRGGPPGGDRDEGRGRSGGEEVAAREGRRVGGHRSKLRRRGWKRRACDPVG